MRIIIDEDFIFDEPELQLQIGSWKRKSIERAAAGVDGVLSIDLGLRDRKITQKGFLSATSGEAMNIKISQLTVLLDGQTHSLTINNKESIENIRLDSFEIVERNYSGNGICCKYHIGYTQLG